MKNLFPSSVCLIVKIICLIFLLEVLIITLFYSGYWFARKDIKVYGGGVWPQFFPKNDPIYNLSQGKELTKILHCMKNNEYDQAKELARQGVVRSLEKAKKRYSHMRPGKNRERLSEQIENIESILMTKKTQGTVVHSL